MHSTIYAYNASNGQLVDTYKRFNYLGGSMGLDWEDFNIESLETTSSVSARIFFKEHYFSMALKDIEFEVNDLSFGTKEGDIFITPPNKAFDLINNSSFAMIRCAMSLDFMKAHFYNKNIDHLSYTENYSVSDNNLKYFLLLIYEQAILGTPYKDPYLNILFDGFVTHYIKEYSNYDIKTDETMLNADHLVVINRYISNHLSDNITSKTLADLVKMSNYTFLNEFKSLTKDTPHQYILKKKLQASKDKLLNSSSSIMTISHELGFTDSSHFTHFFKKQVGESPSKFRKKL